MEDLEEAGLEEQMENQTISFRPVRHIVDGRALHLLLHYMSFETLKNLASESDSIQGNTAGLLTT